MVGGIALRAYMPERATDDLDVLVAAGDGQTALAALERAGYAMVVPHPRGGWRLTHPAAPRPVDLILANTPWLSDALARPARDLVGLPILPRPELLVLQLLAGRPQDYADGVRVLRDTPVAEREQAAALVARVAPAQRPAFQALCTLSDAEFGPVSERQGRSR